MSDDKEIIEQETAEEEKKSNTPDHEDEYEKVCFLCRRPESVTGPMITLPQDIHICTDCMQKSFDSMNNMNLNYSDLMNSMPPNFNMAD